MSPQVETGWLVESGTSPALWWNGIGWTADSWSAMRFARRQDAETYIKFERRRVGAEAIATDHMWIGES